MSTGFPRMTSEMQGSSRLGKRCSVIKCRLPEIENGEELTVAPPLLTSLQLHGADALIFSVGDEQHSGCRFLDC
jgi:hypothetical protein